MANFSGTVSPEASGRSVVSSLGTERFREWRAAGGRSAYGVWRRILNGAMVFGVQEEGVERKRLRNFILMKILGFQSKTCAALSSASWMCGV